MSGAGQNQGMRKPLLFVLVPFLSGCGLVFVNGPPSGWQEIQDVDALETRALIQPCTSSRTLVWVDGVVALAGVLDLVEGEHDAGGYNTIVDDIEEGLYKIVIGSLILGGGIGAIVGLNKVNDCRAFNARLMELGQGGASSLTSHEWLDELSPPPGLGVTVFDPVFGLPIKRGHWQLAPEAPSLAPRPPPGCYAPGALATG